MVEKLLFKGKLISPGTREGPIKHLGESQENFIEKTYDSAGERDPDTYEYDPEVIELLMEVGRGNVIVTHHLTIHFHTEMLYGAVAFILEEGSALSHAASLARELGLPAIVVDDVNDLSHLKEGMRVKVDGNTGSVFLSDLSELQEKEE